jgi:hypothetical protein
MRPQRDQRHPPAAIALHKQGRKCSNWAGFGNGISIDSGSLPSLRTPISEIAKAFNRMAFHPSNLAVLAALALSGCGSSMPNLSLPDVKARNDYKGKPLSAVTARLGYPDYQQTVSGQKVYTWRIGQAVQQCQITVVMAGDVVDSYDWSGDGVACTPYMPPAKPPQPSE